MRLNEQLNHRTSEITQTHFFPPEFQWLPRTGLGKKLVELLIPCYIRLEEAGIGQK